MLNVTHIGQGEVTPSGDGYRLSLPATDGGTYHDAQISSYIRRADFDYTPPVRLTIRAYAEGDLHGTAGFGFWNHPFVPGERDVRLPKAVWFFFASPPNNMALAQGVPGHGWKAATFDAVRWPFFALLPTAPIGVLLMRIPFFYRHLWPVGQRAIGVSETLLESNLLRTPHTYTLDWMEGGARFAVDGKIVHEAHTSPRGRLGFIAWVDNQYAVVTPQGHLGFGLVPVPAPQTLVIESIALECEGCD
ncbi:MAG: hypothetical protein OHK0046_14040 [Anaerolineae bacterium]